MKISKLIFVGFFSSLILASCSCASEVPSTSEGSTSVSTRESSSSSSSEPEAEPLAGKIFKYESIQETDYVVTPQDEKLKVRFFENGDFWYYSYLPGSMFSQEDDVETIAKGNYIQTGATFKYTLLGVETMGVWNPYPDEIKPTLTDLPGEVKGNKIVLTMRTQDGTGFLHVTFVLDEIAA